MSDDRYPIDGSIRVEDFDKTSDAPVDKIIAALLAVKPKGVGYLLILVTPAPGHKEEALFDIASNLSPGQMMLAMDEHSKRLKQVN